MNLDYVTPPWIYDISVLDNRLQSLEKRVNDLAQIIIKLLIVLKQEEKCLNLQNN